MKLTNSHRSSVRPRPFLSNNRAIALLEMLVYMGVFAILTSVGFAAFYRCMENSRALQRNAEDITNALHAGETWRIDVRAAQGNIRIESTEDGQILYLPGPHSEVSYRFATNTVLRRVGNNAWSTVLAGVQATSFVADSRNPVAAWRWELELQTRTKQLSRIQPLFTFIAVPSGTSK